jgi:CSLREA domain-containing protein
MIVHTRSTRRHSFARLLCTLALLAGATLLMRPPVAVAATFTVTKTTDSKDGACNSDCSLREAIIAAHQQPGVDTITLAAGLYRVTLSDLDITSSLNIVGAGAATTIIESNGQDRVFEVRPDTTVTIDKVTVRNGNLQSKGGDGGGILNAGALTLSNSVVSGNKVEYPHVGAGIYTTGQLTLANSTVSGNYSQEGSGGGIYAVGGTVTLTNSTVSENSASVGSGGGIVNKSGTLSVVNSTIRSNSSYDGGGISNSGTLTLTNSTVSGNSVRYNGGGISNGGTLTLTNSTVSGNSAGDNGGGIDNGGALTIINSTVSGNIAESFDSGGGGIYNRGSLTISSSTITDNLADQQGIGGGIVNTASGSMTFSNTIIAGNSAASGPDCAGAITSQGYNLIQNTAGCTISGTTTGNRTGVSAQLGPLQNNGGPTLTHLPASGSPALDAGNPATVGSGGSACPSTDQRGVTRPKDGNGDGAARCDIGAVER